MANYCSCVVQSATIHGVEALLVSVEVVISSGIPSFSIVGMPDSAIQESRERVRAALRASGFVMPSDKIVVNLAPGSLKKRGSGFDLPIALALLIATKQIPSTPFSQALVVGELSLDGSVRGIEGSLAFQQCAKAHSLSFITGVPQHSLAKISGLQCFILESLGKVRQGLLDEAEYSQLIFDERTPDYADIFGQEAAKRALQIAAAGSHGLLMVGPPGSGKTMLARAFSSILPELEESKRIETALVYSVLGESIDAVLSGHRPFRSPHHSVTSAGLLGGGSPVRPGEISLAHEGVLFLDELAEFKASVLQGLRQPLEEGVVRITRADGSYIFPSRFMLLAATNPCPCGYFGDRDVVCKCSTSQVVTYQNRIGGPLLDRIDIRIDVSRCSSEGFFNQVRGASSSQLRDGVLRARSFAQWRQEKTGKDSSTSIEGLLYQCSLKESARLFFEEMVRAKNMSGRSVLKTLALVRTIADFDEAQNAHEGHISEALALRFQSEKGL